MTGYIHSKGHRLTGRQIRGSLQRVNPIDHHRRREDIVRRQNPVPYNAPYHGNKLHCDQNEKLFMYGCTLYAFSDGCSSKILKIGCMPRKNAKCVYSYFRLGFTSTLYRFLKKYRFYLKCIGDKMGYYRILKYLVRTTVV